MILRNALRSVAFGVALTLSSSPAMAAGAGVSSMYYADLAAWADFREQNPAPVATMGEGAAMPAPNIFEQRFTAAATRFSQKWGSLPQQRVEPGPTLSEGASGPRVAALRSRLGLAPGSLFDAELAQRIADYRRAHGLSSGTQADGALIASLNLGHAHYARLIELNTKRTKQFPANPGNRFVLVDSAEQRLYMYENGQPVDSMKVIVGKPADQTPMLAGFISFAEINPYWNVPPDLVRERYAARVISGGKNYLDTRGFEVLESWEDDARVLSFAEVDWKAVQAGRQSVWMRQKPGAGNGMGRVKFMFPNRYGVYLHDTPSKNLFDKAERLESAGCVRVERPWDLARWLYGRDLDWRGRPNAQRVDVPNPVPVYLTYFTAVPNGEGFEFRTDVYGKDRYAL